MVSGHGGSVSGFSLFLRLRGAVSFEDVGCYGAGRGTESFKSISPALPLKLLSPDCLGERVGAPEYRFVGNIDLFVVVVPNRNEKCKFLVKQTFLRAVLEN